MIEAQITCLCSMIRLVDMGLILVKGQVVYVDASKAKSSKDIAIAAKVGGIIVRYVARCQERVGDDRLSSLPSHMVVSKPLPVPAPSLPSSDQFSESENLDLDLLTSKIKEGLCSREDVERIVQAQIQKAVAALTGPLAGLNVSLQQAVESIKSVPLRSYEGKVQEGVIGSDVPQFIPDGLVNTELKADISVQEDKFEGGEVDAATKALRKMREKKKGGKL